MAHLDLAIQAARAAGKHVLQHFRLPLDVRAKGAHDYVTDVDLEAEALIVRMIHEQCPADGFLGEEGHSPDPTDHRVWVIDPLDGTRNYTVGIPFFCVSIALCIGGQTELGVIYDPVRDEVFSALTGGGSYLNGQPIQNEPKTDYDGAIAYVGWKPDLPSHSKGFSLPLFECLRRSVAAMRNIGSAALSLAYVSCGRIDIAFHDRLSAWDMLAGALLIEEAGGTVTDTDGRPITLRSQDIVAANGAELHASVLQAAREVKQGDGLVAH
jgi:myo-inositol-1(or 4)-monophosphatase